MSATRGQMLTHIRDLRSRAPLITDPCPICGVTLYLGYPLQIKQHRAAHLAEAFGCPAENFALPGYGD